MPYELMSRVKNRARARSLLDADQASTPVVATKQTKVARSVPVARTGRIGAIDDPLGGQAAPADVLATLRRNSGSGTPLPPQLAASAADQLGQDLSHVRVHTDAGADRLARSVQSVAFTHGSDIYFSHGMYAPGSGAGSNLLAHELAHVAQGPGSNGAIIGRADDPAEAAADRVADCVAPALRRLQGDGPEQHGSLGWLTGTEPDHRSSQPNTVRRRITGTGSDIRALRSADGLKKGAKHKDTLHKLALKLDKHSSLSDEKQVIRSLRAITALSSHFVKHHKSSRERAKIALVADIKAEAHRDLGQLLAQQRYLNDARAGLPATVTTRCPSSGQRRR